MLKGLDPVFPKPSGKLFLYATSAKGARTRACDGYTTQSANSSAEEMLRHG